MDLHLDDAVAEGNSMVNQMKGHSESAKISQNQQLNHWSSMLGVAHQIKGKADSATQVTQMVGDVGQAGLGLSKEGSRIAKVGLAKYGGEQVEGAVSGLKNISGVKAGQQAYGIYKSATFKPGGVGKATGGLVPQSLGGTGDVGGGAGDQYSASIKMRGMSGKGVSTVGAEGEQATSMSRASQLEGGLGNVSQSEDYFSSARPSTVASTSEALSGELGTAKLGSQVVKSATEGTSAVTNLSKGVGGGLQTVGGKLGQAAESGMGKAVMGSAKVMGVIGGGMNLAEDLQGGKFHIAGHNTAEKIGNVSGMVSAGLDAASLAVPVLAPLAAMVGLFSAVDTGIGDLEEAHTKKVAANKGLANQKIAPEQASNLQSMGLVANRQTDTTHSITGSSSF